MNRNVCYLFIVFFFQACGTTGHLKFYDFSTSKYEVEKELLSVINTDSAYSVPAKWQSHTTGDYFERIYIYFASEPEELYQIGFTRDSIEWVSSPTCRLGVISIYQGDKFLYNSDLSSNEIERVLNRFEQEILNKIKYTFYKTD